jgi:hypothetical protein
VTIFTLRISLWTRIELSDSFEYMWFKHLVVSVSLDQLLKFDSWLLPPPSFYFGNCVYRTMNNLTGLFFGEKRERGGPFMEKRFFFFIRKCLIHSCVHPFLSVQVVYIQHVFFSTQLVCTRLTNYSLILIWYHSQCQNSFISTKGNNIKRHSIFERR